MTDFQNRVGSKPGSGGVASWAETNADRRERLRKLAMETIDLGNDPYFMRNHLGTYECKLCLTIHTNEGSYLVHTQGKKHQTNLARRAAKEAKEGSGAKAVAAQAAANQGLVPVMKKSIVRIGRPGYRITKIKEGDQYGLLFQIFFPELDGSVEPLFRIMSAFEQKKETPDRRMQYLIVAAEPYETVAFKIPAVELDVHREEHLSYFDGESKQFTIQILFKDDVFAHSLVPVQ